MEGEVRNGNSQLRSRRAAARLRKSGCPEEEVAAQGSLEDLHQILGSPDLKAFAGVPKEFQPSRGCRSTMGCYINSLTF
jgi:hypothetical protein